MKKLLQLVFVASLALMTACPKHGVGIAISDTTSGITSFVIYRGATCGSLAQLATTSSDTYLDSAVTAGSSYCYAARAVDSGGLSAESNTVVVTIP